MTSAIEAGREEGGNALNLPLSVRPSSSNIERTFLDIEDAGGRMLARLFPYANPDADAHAQLFAAAPELLEALEPFARTNPHKNEDGSSTVMIGCTVAEIRRAIAAITKARAAS